MKLTQWYEGDLVHLGLWLPEGIFDITANAQPGWPRDMAEAIENPDGLKAVLEGLSKNPKFLSPDSLRFAPMVSRPEKILCVGVNYRKHAEETGSPLPSHPLIFAKCANTLAAHGEAIPMPSVSDKIDYEAELVLVVGKTCKDVPKEKALSCLFGYTLGNDLSARDLQRRTSQWLIGKSLDRFGPTGPCVVTADEVNPNDLELSSRVNGQLRQMTNTSDMIFDCADIVSYLSSMMTLKAGDLIFTGTPSGVAAGYPQGQQPWLTAGDQVEIHCPAIGSLVNCMVKPL